MNVRQKLDALGFQTGDHDADVHAALDALLALTGKAPGNAYTLFLIAKRSTSCRRSRSRRV